MPTTFRIFDITIATNAMRRLKLFAVAVLMMPFTVAAQPNVDFDEKMREYGLVNIRDIDKNILVELKYSTEDNFVGEDMYGTLEDAYFEREFAAKLAHAQRLLTLRKPSYRLLIYDAARPLSVQRYMRSLVEGTELQSFVADGTKGGRHNYGVAVDLTLATNNGTPLDMGALFDDFTEAAAVKGTPDTDDPKSRTPEVYRRYAEEQVQRGIISREAADNRLLLIEVMYEAGLVPYRREWWHFEEISSMSKVREEHQLLDF